MPFSPSALARLQWRRHVLGVPRDPIDPMNASPPPEADPWDGMMARAQDGDRESYRRLLEEAAPLLRRVAMRALRDPVEAEDAVQDTLLTLHAARHTYDPDRPFRPWLLALARARIADRQRRSVRRARNEVPLDPTHETFPAQPTKHDTAADTGTLHAAIASLPDGQRLAIRLLKLEEMSLKEASAHTGLSVTALKVATHRGLVRLRKMLGQWQ